MASPTLVVSVLGLSRLDGENFGSHQGIGKSCLCYRFMYPGYDDYVSDHRSLLALHEFESDVVHRDHFLYWGSTTRTYGAKGASEKVHFEILEYTVFYQDVRDEPFRINSKKPVTSLDGYMKMAIGSTLESPGKISYKNRDLICTPQDYESVVFPPGIGKYPRGYVVVIDVSDGGPRFESRLSLTEKMVAHLASKKQKFVVAATKRDEAITTSLQKLSELAKTSKFTLIEVSSKSNVNVSEAFESVAVKVLGKLAQGISNQVLSYSDAAQKTLSNRDKARRGFRAFLQKRVTLASERLKAIECTEEYKACAHLHGKFETDKMFAQHVLMVRNDEVSGYAGVMDNVEMRQEFLEDFIAERTDLSLYANYLKDLIIRICKKCSNEMSPPLSPPPPPHALPEKDPTFGTFIPILIPPNPPHEQSPIRNGEGDTQEPEGADGGHDGDDDDDNYVPVNNDSEDDKIDDDYEPMQGGETNDEEQGGETNDEEQGGETSDEEGHDYINTSEIPGLNLKSVPPTTESQPSAQKEGKHQKKLSLTQGNTSLTPMAASNMTCVDPPTSPLSRSRGAQDQAGQGGNPTSPLSRSRGAQDQAGQGGNSTSPLSRSRGAQDQAGQGGNPTSSPSQLKKGPPPLTKEKPAPPKRSTSINPPASNNGTCDPETVTKPGDDRTTVRTTVKNDTVQQALEQSKEPPQNSVLSPVTNATTESIVVDSQVEKPLLAKIREKLEKEKEKPKIPTVPLPPVPSPKPDGFLNSSSAFKPQNKTSPPPPPSVVTPNSPRLGHASDSTVVPTFSLPPFKLPATSPRFGQASDPTVPRSPAIPRQPYQTVEVSLPTPHITTVQLPRLNGRAPPDSNLPNTNPPRGSTESASTADIVRRTSSPSPPAPPLPDRPEDEDGSEQESNVGEASPAPSKIKRAYELVVKKFTGKSSSVDESKSRQLPTESIQASNSPEPRKATFIDMKKRPLPPEPPAGGICGGGHGNASDEELHDYERVEDGTNGWVSDKGRDVRRAKSFNTVGKKKCDNGEYENEAERPRPPEPLPQPAPSTDNDDRWDYDYPRIPGTLPPSHKPVPPKRVKVKMDEGSTSPLPHHGSGIHVSTDQQDDRDKCASFDDSYVNWAPEESRLSTAKLHSHSAEDLSVYMNLPLPDPTPTRTSPAPGIITHLPPKANPGPPVNPRPCRSQTNAVSVEGGVTLPRTAHNPLLSSLPSRGLRTQVQKAPGVVTKPLPPRNLIRRPNDHPVKDINQ